MRSSVLPIIIAGIINKIESAKNPKYFGGAGEHLNNTIVFSSAVSP